MFVWKNKWSMVSPVNILNGRVLSPSGQWLQLQQNWIKNQNQNILYFSSARAEEPHCLCYHNEPELILFCVMKHTTVTPLCHHSEALPLFSLINGHPPYLFLLSLLFLLSNLPVSRPCLQLWVAYIILQQWQRFMYSWHSITQLWPSLCF